MLGYAMSPLLDFEPGLVAVKRTDVESRLLADRHYSRQTPGAREFMGNGRTLVLRDAAGTVVFGWLYPKASMHVIDAVWCSIFRNEGPQRSSDLILEAELCALARWPQLPRFAHVHRPAEGRVSESGVLLQGRGLSPCGRQYARSPSAGEGTSINGQGGT